MDPLRTCIIGADTPLGMTFVRRTLERGDVVVALHPNPARVPLLGDLAHEHHGRLHALPADTTRADACARLEALVGACLPAVDRLVWAGFRDTVGDAVPGTPQNARLDTVDPTVLLESFRVNAVQPVLAVRALRPLLRRGAAPRALLVGTWLGSIGRRHDGGAYGLAASGAALNMVARSLALELDADGIAVIAGNPGNYKTALHGPAFQLQPDDSAGGLLAALEALPPDATGLLLDWTGQETPW